MQGPHTHTHARTHTHTHTCTHARTHARTHTHTHTHTSFTQITEKLQINEISCQSQSCSLNEPHGAHKSTGSPGRSLTLTQRKTHFTLTQSETHFTLTQSETHFTLTQSETSVNSVRITSVSHPTCMCACARVCTSTCVCVNVSFAQMCGCYIVCLLVQTKKRQASSWVFFFSQSQCSIVHLSMESP